MSKLQTIIDKLCQNRVVLASQSPRRKELMQLMGFKNIEIIPSTFEENLQPEDFPTIEEFVIETALQKVKEVDSRLISKPAMILGSDTVVTFNGKVFGKPKDRQDAFETLAKLSGNVNVVYTGVVIKLADSPVFHKCIDSTKVTFGKLGEARIWEYIDTGEPMDKAGGYAIQGYGSTIVEKIDGNVATVIGLPVYKLTEFLLNNC